MHEARPLGAVTIWYPSPIGPGMEHTEQRILGWLRLFVRFSVPGCL